MAGTTRVFFLCFEMLLSKCKQTGFEHIFLENGSELAMNVFIETISRLIINHSMTIKLLSLIRCII